MGAHLSRTLAILHEISATNQVDEDVLLEKRGKHAKKAKSGGGSSSPKDSSGTPKKDGNRADRFREKRRTGKLKRHKERIVITKDEKGKLRGKSKFANAGTFRPCAATPDGKEGSLRFRKTGDKSPRKGGAMISNKGLRQKIPLDRFVNRNSDNPTGPMRKGCRASVAGVLRSRAFPGTGSNYASAVEKRVNKSKDKSKQLNMTAHKQGQRETKHRGPSGAAERHPEYGKLTGRKDEKPHTNKDEWGKKFNRPVTRVDSGKGQTRIEKTVSKGKAKKAEAGRKATGKRGEKELGRKNKPNPQLKKEREKDEGAKLAAKYKARTGKSKTTGKGKKKKRQTQK